MSRFFDVAQLLSLVLIAMLCWAVHDAYTRPTPHMIADQQYTHNLHVAALDVATHALKPARHK